MFFVFLFDILKKKFKNLRSHTNGVGNIELSMKMKIESLKMEKYNKLKKNKNTNAKNVMRCPQFVVDIFYVHAFLYNC